MRTTGPATRDPEFERIYAEHHADLVRAARRWLRDDRAEHVAHDVLLAHWQHPERYDAGRASLRTFLLLNCRHRAIDVCRSDSARSRRDRSYGASAPATLDDTMPTGDRDIVEAALAQLSNAQREAIVLAFYGGLTYQEVAARLGHPEGTVKTRIRSGLARLRAIVEPPAPTIAT